MVAAGTAVTLTPNAGSGSIFSSWSGGGCTGTSPCTVTPSADVTVTANFAVAGHTLTIQKTGSGTVMSTTPTGISCGATCAKTFADQTKVTLSASAADGYTFTSWSGGGCTGNGSCVVTITTDVTVTANFTALPMHKLTVTVSGTGTGMVMSSPSGITCSSGMCSAMFTDGTSISLSAMPGMNSALKTWSGACSGAGSCMVTLNGADQTVGADFEPTVTLNVTVTPDSSHVGAAVTSTPAGISCTTGTCSASFATGTSVTLHGDVSVDWTGAATTCTAAKTCALGALNATKSVGARMGYAHLHIDIMDNETMSPGEMCDSVLGCFQWPGTSYVDDTITIDRTYSLDVSWTGHMGAVSWSNVGGCGIHTICSFTPTDEIIGSINITDQ
jgi:uncharacterized repeat protein (TIGR02543 family)